MSSRRTRVEREMLPLSAATPIWPNTVTPTGTVFYARSGLGCGKHVVLHEYAAGVDTPLTVLPTGYDLFTKTFAVDEGAGVTSVYFDRVQCSTGKSHIYKLTVS